MGISMVSSERSFLLEPVCILEAREFIEDRILNSFYLFTKNVTDAWFVIDCLEIIPFKFRIKRTLRPFSSHQPSNVLIQKQPQWF